MARVLIVGCGCRGRQLARELVAEGHAVRGTTRDEGRIAEIEAAGAEGVVADPDRLATLVPALTGVTVICWLMGDAAPDVNGPRLRTLLERLVDTPVRGFVYEASGRAAPESLAEGFEAVSYAADTWRIPAEVIDARGDQWLPAMKSAVERLL